MGRIAGIIGSLAVGFLMTAAGLAWDVHTLTYVGVILLAVAALLWIIDWKRPKPTFAVYPQDSAPPAHNPNRIYLQSNVDRAFLVGLFDDKTEIQGDRAASAYIGKWMAYTGRISDIGKIGKLIAVYTGHGEAVLTFQEKLERFEVLQKGDVISVKGQLEAVTPHWIRLEKCELINVAPAAKKT